MLNVEYWMFPTHSSEGLLSGGRTRPCMLRPAPSPTASVDNKKPSARAPTATREGACAPRKNGKARLTSVGRGSCRAAGLSTSSDRLARSLALPRCATFLCLAALAAIVFLLSGCSSGPHKPRLMELQCFPSAVKLNSAKARQQIVVEAVYA